MVQAVLVAGAVAGGAADWHMQALKQAKFQHPVRPGDVLVIEAAVDARGAVSGAANVRAKLSVGDRGVVEISLVAMPAGVEQGV